MIFINNNVEKFVYQIGPSGNRTGKGSSSAHSANHVTTQTVKVIIQKPLLYGKIGLTIFKEHNILH